MGGVWTRVRPACHAHITNVSWQSNAEIGHGAGPGPTETTGHAGRSPGNQFLRGGDPSRMNTKLRFASLLAGAAILVAACGSGNATTAPATTAPESGSPAAPSAEPLSGEITLWHSYGSGGGETGAFQKALGAILTANKDLKVNVVEQPFSDIFNKWTTDVSAGGGPDMFIAPNDNLFTQSDAGVLADLTTALEGNLEGFNQVAVDGSKVDGKFFMVPESLKAVALWYDKSAIP